MLFRSFLLGIGFSGVAKESGGSVSYEEDERGLCVSLVCEEEGLIGVWVFREEDVVVSFEVSLEGLECFGGMRLEVLCKGKGGGVLEEGESYVLEEWGGFSFHTVHLGSLEEEGASEGEGVGVTGLCVCDDETGGSLYEA